jgi:hypothetical protein
MSWLLGSRTYFLRRIVIRFLLFCFLFTGFRSVRDADLAPPRTPSIGVMSTETPAEGSRSSSSRTPTEDSSDGTSANIDPNLVLQREMFLLIREMRE